MHHTFLEHLDWRRAEKHFDPNYQLPQETLDKILHAAKMAPTSFGLQPFHIYAVSNSEVKAQLKEKGFHQPQFTDASVILVFTVLENLEQRTENYLEKIQAPEQFAEMLRGFISQLPNEHARRAWAARQAYIALGFALAAAAELQVDSCPMEGFDNAGFDEVLKLPADQKSVVVLSLGKRVEEPARPKFRFPDNDLFTKI